MSKDISALTAFQQHTWSLFYSVAKYSAESIVTSKIIDSCSQTFA